MSKDSILIIDDKSDSLKSLSKQLQKLPCMKSVEVVQWTPTGKEEKNPSPEFHKIIKETAPVLVVTDYDLTTKGYNGLFGPTITQWCHKTLIPVIEFSREFNEYLPKMPNLFNLRAPESEKKLPHYISALTEGFLKLHELIRKRESIRKSYSSLLYEIFGNGNCKKYEMSDYFSHFFKNVDFLYERISICERQGDEISASEYRRILTYILGHIILNSILRFPGPILSKRALCAYVAVDYSELGKLQKLFADAKYDGPFDKVNEYYWRMKVDDKIGNLVEAQLENENFLEQNRNKDIVELNRSAIEIEIGELTKHSCKNGCNGDRGGFYCPFTLETVCKSKDCSVSTSSWIPHGANICRVEKKFFEHWSPLLST